MVRVFGDTIYAEFPKSLHCDFYNDSTQIETWLDAKYGKYYEGLNKVYLRDSVVMINIKGDTLKSPDLWWDQNTKLFYTDSYAEYRTKDKKIFPSKGIEATQDFSRVTFRYPTGVVKVKESGFPIDKSLQQRHQSSIFRVLTINNKPQTINHGVSLHG